MRDSSPNNDVQIIEEEGHAPRLNEISKNFIAECVAEKERIGKDFPVSAMLLNEAIDRVYSTGRVPGREMHADVFKQKLIKVSQKVFVPVKQFPNFNFNGKILGPKGNSLRNLQKQTLCRILIKGRGSMRDAEKEQELRDSGDPRHSHLEKDLYVEISTVATPAEAHARIAYALAEIRKYLIPDSNDEVTQSQRREMYENPEFAKLNKNFLGERAAANKPRVSILQKITGLAGQPSDSGMEVETHDVEEVQADVKSRRSILRAPMKRSLPENPPYQRRNEIQGETRRQVYRPEGRPTVSILKKVTAYNDYDDQEEFQDEAEYEAMYEDDQRYVPQPMRPVSQRPAGKRFFQETPTPNRRYEIQQKRTREVYDN